MWSWWIVILCSYDWYCHYHEAKIVRARNAGEASKKARKGEDDHVETEDIFGPFAGPPGRCGG